MFFQASYCSQSLCSLRRERSKMLVYPEANGASLIAIPTVPSRPPSASIGLYQRKAKETAAAVHQEARDSWWNWVEQWHDGKGVVRAGSVESGILPKIHTTPGTTVSLQVLLLWTRGLTPGRKAENIEKI
ncbi:unnamed protein product [Pleuronectes platessa]|uniref:Uncharacterized protein n=1 Tax=Pleuronectes platessa TaxID=8262 RepID=A0A9N7ZEX5_PLEPL|nr:unnamed protein product [Pleuronectes platessa]